MRKNITEIQSRSNPVVKWAASLKDKKYREEAKSFVAEGEKLVFEAIGANLPVTHLFIAKKRSDYFLQKLENTNAPSLDNCLIYLLADEIFEKISSENSPQGIICVIKHLDFFNKSDIIYKEEFLKNPSDRVMILSSVRDPGNLGSAIRSAVAFGTRHLILSSDCADVYNSKTVRGAMGSLFRVRISIVTNLPKTVEELRAAGRRVLSAELCDSAMKLGEDKLLASDVIIIGNEGHGVDKEVSCVATDKIYIPISVATESLNASVAAAIFMWEQSKS